MIIKSFSEFEHVTKDVTGTQNSKWYQDQRDQVLKIMFNENEGVCYGTAYATAVNKIPLGDNNQYQYLSINPLDRNKDHLWFQNEGKYNEFVPRRCDFNVTCFRNFMFEMDDTPLEQQRKILEECSIPWSIITFSGNKSYHAVLSVEGGIPNAEISTIPGLESYKLSWRKLAAHINKTGEKLFGKKDNGYVDQSSKNPSRFTRFPLSYRVEKNNFQHICYFNSRISQDRFVSLMELCPEVKNFSNGLKIAPEETITEEKLFFEYASSGLQTKLKYVTWGGSAGMYYEIFKLTLWAIDDTNVDRDTFLEILWKYTFPQLIEHYAYPKEKCEIGVRHAYSKKFPGVYNG
jgi:hypothetical protein